MMGHSASMVLVGQVGPGRPSSEHGGKFVDDLFTSRPNGALSVASLIRFLA
jgi:hypothetical protein